VAMSAAIHTRSTKPLIVTNDHADWNDLVEQVFAELVRVNAPDPQLFQRGIALVRVRVDEDGRPLIEPMTETSLRGHLARTMLWERRNERGFYLPVPPPVAVVKNLMSRKEWTGIPALRDIVQAPIFTRDGHIIGTPGYHPEAHLWYAPWSATAISVPERPTATDLIQARELILNDLLSDFPFDGEASRAHAVAAILLPFVRELIQGPTPLHLFMAPTPGSGKGLLVDVTSLIATGRPSLPVSAPRDDEEMRKRITAQLRRGTPIIVLDNLTQKLDSAALCAALTASEWQDRILGVSEMSSTLPNRALWAATGNNPELSLDIARRTVTCRLDPGVERPWDRTGFRHPDLRQWVLAHRAELVAAMLTMVRAWLVAGAPRVEHPPIGSFESWAAVLAGALGIAGITGFLTNYKDVYEAASSEVGEWVDFVGAWFDVHGPQPVLVKDLCDLAHQKELLPDVLGDGMDTSQRTRLGNALASRRGRIFAGYQIHFDGRSKHGTQYRLKVVAVPFAVAEAAVTLAEEAPF
jgi:putative DNA primase/helicase